MEHTFYVIGLGSMGKRRIRNLLALGIPKKRIVGFDPNSARRREAQIGYRIKTVADFEKGFNEDKPSALIISTPPHRHAQYFLFAARRKIHFFVEVTTTDDGYAKLMPRLDGTFISAPSCTFRYAPAVRKMREMVQKGAIGKPLFFQHYLGQYLPDWHPYEDYRKVYFSRKKTGGAREMFPYELQWIGFILESGVKKAIGLNKKISNLDMDADDMYSAILEYKNGAVGSVNVDLLNRTATRTFRLVGSDGTLEWNWMGHTIKMLKPKKRVRTIRIRKERKLRHYNTTENIYIAEMKDFVDAVAGKRKYPYSYQEDREILRALRDVEKNR